jgi:transposase-like protein
MTKISYSGYRFTPEIFQQSIWLYVRFTLNFRDVEDLMAEREIAVSYETVRRWVNHFGPKIAADLRTPIVRQRDKARKTVRSVPLKGRSVSGVVVPDCSPTN